MVVLEFTDGLLSLVFFFVELGILVLVLQRGRHHPHWKMISALLVLLMVYQLAEFLICIGVDPNIVGRIAFFTITLLPPTGYIFSTQLVGYKRPDWIIPTLAGLAFGIYYVIIPESIRLLDCNPFYATYYYPRGYLYGGYYMAVIFYSIGFLAYHIGSGSRAEGIDTMQLQLVAGYMAFLLPMALTIFYDSEYLYSIPSIMCKYAITLALVLGYMALSYKPQAITD